MTTPDRPRRTKRAKRSAAPKTAPLDTVAVTHRPFESLAAAKKKLPPTSAPVASGASAKRTPSRPELPGRVELPLDHGALRPAGPVSPTAREGSVKPSDAAAPPRPVAPFAAYITGVRPLQPGPTRLPRGESAIERGSPATGDSGAAATSEGVPPEEAHALERLKALVGEGFRFEVIDDGTRLEGRRLDVDPRELRRLRRGQYTVDGELDLHGMRVDQARSAVTEFVRARGRSGDRSVLLIPGKGDHSVSHVPVLRGEIAAWLTHSGLARHVQAFVSALAEDGGAGAIYVLLAR